MKPYYTDDRIRLFHGDALEVMDAMDDRTVDVVLTDPPYSSGGRRENARSLRKSMVRSMSDDDWIRGDGMSTQGFIWFMRQCGVQWRRLLTPGGHVFSFIDWRMAPNLAAALESADLRQHPTLVWDKTHFGMGAKPRCSSASPPPATTAPSAKSTWPPGTKISPTSTSPTPARPSPAITANPPTG